MGSVCLIYLRMTLKRKNSTCIVKTPLSFAVFKHFFMLFRKPLCTTSDLVVGNLNVELAQAKKAAILTLDRVN